MTSISRFDIHALCSLLAGTELSLMRKVHAFAWLLAIAAPLFLISLLAAFFRFRMQCRTLELQRSEEQRRIEASLNEQRAIRTQNEALTREISERKKVEEQLRYAAYHDSATGLYNRAYILQRISASLERIKGRHPNHSALLYIDLDRFKSINNMAGHRLGDLFLEEITQRLRRITRKHDTLARIGGDEFAILLEQLHSPQQAFTLAQRILSIIEEPGKTTDILFPITASIGICHLNQLYAQPDDVLRDADTAMHCAKREGGARALVYETYMHEEALAAIEAKMDLKAAVEEKQFELHFQPLVDLRDRSICGMEALCRWNHPLRGLVGPTDFIPLAEQTGYIIPLGAWVLQQACLDYKKLTTALDKELLLTVNVTTAQLNEPTYLSDLKRILDETQMDPALLQLEITESVFLHDAERVGKLLNEIRSLDIKVAFDDFGTGYSSLNYLSRFPIDTLKIDRSFVSGLPHDPVNADIVQLIIQLAHATGMNVSAEGVEDPTEAAMLIDYGCNVAQGFLFSKPVPLSAMQHLLKRGLPHPRAKLRIVANN